MQIYVLADTTYNSLSVDEVAASHINADCVVHYGRASLTKLSRIPAYYVFPIQQIDVNAVVETLASSSFFNLPESDDGENAPHPKTIIFLDQVLLDSLEALETSLKSKLGDSYANSLIFARVSSRTAEPQQSVGCCGGASCDSAQPAADRCCAIANNESKSNTNIVAGYSWDKQSLDDDKDRECRFVWIGSSAAPALEQLQLTHSAASWLCLDPSTNTLTEGLPLEVSRLLRRRYFLIEKARQANIVGILVGTLGAAGYGNALRKLRTAAQAAGKKTYTLLMGKPSPAKLANFPEIEVFVLVADPQGQILDSKEYLAPIITPHEAMLAFTEDSEWNESEYRLDFDHVVGEERAEKEVESSSEELTALVAQAQQALIVTPAAAGGGHLVEAKSAADYLVHKRSWKGVEAPLVGAEKKEAHVAVMGQSGRAAGYTHEPEKR